MWNFLLINMYVGQGAGEDWGKSWVDAIENNMEPDLLCEVQIKPRRGKLIHPSPHGTCKKMGHMTLKYYLVISLAFAAWMLREGRLLKETRNRSTKGYCYMCHSLGKYERYFAFEKWSNNWNCKESLLGTLVVKWKN